MTKCEHCGFKGEHPGVCPNIKAIEYFANGKIKRVEYKTTADYAIPYVPYTPVPQPYTPTYPWYAPIWSTTTNSYVDPAGNRSSYEQARSPN